MRYSDFKIVETTLKEASGIFNRQAGQRFYNPETEHTIEFVKVVGYPSDMEQFESAEGRDAAIEQLNQSLDVPIQWTNNPMKSTLAFGLAYLEDVETGEVHIFGRYFNKMNQAGLPANWNSANFHGYKLQTGAAAKMTAGLQPQDILGVEESRYQGLENLMNAVRANLKDKPEILAGFETVAAGQLPAVFEGQRALGPAIRDFAGEVIQPIGIMSGADMGAGIKAAKADLIPNVDWSELQLYWPAGKNHALVDSVFVREDGLEIGISSKGKDGADASMKNIQDAIQTAREKRPQLIKSYEDVVEIVDLIDSNTAEEGPLAVAEHIGLLEKRTTDFIRKMKGANMSVEDIQAAHNQIPQLLEVYQAFGAKLDHPNYNIYFHMVSNTSKMVGAALNKRAKFGEGMMEFMKQASIVQVYTDIGNSGGDVSITGFRSVYPPQFEGVVTVNGGKNYAATKIFGKMAFSMPKGK